MWPFIEQTSFTFTLSKTWAIFASREGVCNDSDHAADDLPFQSKY